jgi:hypothetical protein
MLQGEYNLTAGPSSRADLSWRAKTTLSLQLFGFGCVASQSRDLFKPVAKAIEEFAVEMGLWVGE